LFAHKEKINFTTFIKNWKRKRLEMKTEMKKLEIKLLLHSLSKYFEKLQQLTHGKQKWRFLGLYVAFRLGENVRFIWKFRLKAPPSLTMGTLCAIIFEHLEK
jgi:hypothetical protein